MISAVSSVWMYLLVTEPFAWPTRTAMVTSVKPRSLAMLAKLWRRTWGVIPYSGESSKRCFQWFGEPPNALSSPCPGKTCVPRPSVRRRSSYSMIGNLMGRMDSPSLLSSSRKQFASVSAAVHFRPVISLRRQLVSASWQMMKAPLCNPCLRNELDCTPCVRHEIGNRSR